MNLLDNTLTTDAKIRLTDLFRWKTFSQHHGDLHGEISVIKTSPSDMNREILLGYLRDAYTYWLMKVSPT